MIEDPMITALTFYVIGVIVGIIIGWRMFKGDC